MRKAIITVVVLLAFATLLFYFHLWGAVLTWAYLAIFLLLALIPIIGYDHYTSLTVSNKDDFIKNVLYALPLSLYKNPFQKLLIRIESALVTLVNSFAWPVTFFYVMKLASGGKPDVQRLVQAQQKVPQIYVLGYYVFFSLMLVVAYYFSALTTIHLKMLAVPALICLTAYLLYFLLTDNIGGAIKTTPLNVYAGIILSCVCITVCSVLLFIVILSLFRFGHLSSDSITVVHHEYFKQQSLLSLLSGNFAPINILTLIVDLSGLLFGATVIATIRDFKGYKRDIHDNAAVAQRFLIAKQYQQSADWQSKVPKEQWDNSFWERYIVTLIALNQTEKAINELPRLLYGDHDTSHIDDYRFFYIMERAVYYGIKKEMLINVYYAWIKVCKSEGVFQSSISNLSNVLQDNYFLNEIEGNEPIFQYIKRHHRVISLFLDFYAGEKNMDEVESLLEDLLRKNKTDDFTNALAHYVLLAHLMRADKYNKPAILTTAAPLLESIIAITNNNADLAFIVRQLVGLTKAAKWSRLKQWDAIIEITEKLKTLFKQDENTKIIEKFEGLKFE